MATIRFNVKPVSKSKMQVRAVFQNGQVQRFKFTGETIPANKVSGKYKYWDNTTQQVRGIDGAHRINALINKWKTAFQNYQDNCKRKEQRIDIEIFIKSLATTNGVINGIVNDEAVTLVSVIDSFLAFIKKSHENITYRGYNTIKEQVIKLQQHTGNTYYTSEIDGSFHKAFVQYLVDKENNTNLTILRKQTKIITILNYARNELKIKLSEDYKKVYKIKATAAPKFPLLPEELATLRGHKCETEYQQMVLDSFLLACETGLRHSDIKQLQVAHIKTHVGATGIIRFIELNNFKGKKKNSMSLSENAMHIVDKYTAAAQANEKTNLFRYNHSQAASTVLKLIFKHKDVKLDRPCEIMRIQHKKTLKEVKPLHDIISFHMGRNTYITRLISAGVNPAFVQDNAGHSDLRTTMGYYRDNAISRWQETLKVLNTPFVPSKDKMSEN